MKLRWLIGGSAAAVILSGLVLATVAAQQPAPESAPADSGTLDPMAAEREDNHENQT